MALIPAKCMYCDGDEVVKYGSNPNGKQRMMCKECKKTFQLEYSNKAATVDAKLMIIKMGLNGSGVRNTARVLDISPTTVIDVLKKLKIFLAT
jgi:transposase-like protein